MLCQREGMKRLRFCRSSPSTPVQVTSWLTFGHVGRLLAKAQALAPALGEHLVRDAAALLESISLLFMQPQPVFASCSCKCAHAADEGAEDKEELPKGFCKDWPGRSDDPGAAGGAAPVISWLQSLPTDDDIARQASAAGHSQHPHIKPQALPARSAASALPPLGNVSQESAFVLRQRRPPAGIPASSRSSSLGSKLSSAGSAGLAPPQQGLWLTYADTQLEREFAEFHAGQQSKVGTCKLC